MVSWTRVEGAYLSSKKARQTYVALQLSYICLSTFHTMVAQGTYDAAIQTVAQVGKVVNSLSEKVSYKARLIFIYNKS